MLNKSFTLIELLVVIVIIGILAGVIIISTSSSIDKASFAKAQAFSKTIQSELLLNLVSEWTFDESAVNNITKDSWGSNHSTLGDGTTTTTFPMYKTKDSGECVFGGCYNFDGGDYINIPHDSSINASKNITATIWFKTNTTVPNYQQVLGKQTYLNEYRLILIYNTIQGHIWSSTTGYTVNSANNNMLVKTNDWYCVVITYDGQILKLYVNGVLSDSLPVSIIINHNENSMSIGRNSSNVFFFNGLIDDTRIYNTALSSSQIKQNYIAGLDSLFHSGNISKEEYNQRISELAYEK